MLSCAPYVQHAFWIGCAASSDIVAKFKAKFPSAAKIAGLSEEQVGEPVK
jgi:hypothetical protein